MNQSQLSLMLPTHLCGQSQCRAVVAGTAIPNTDDDARCGLVAA
jgi:hypothetical protein